MAGGMKLIQLFLNVDNEGNIVQTYSGKEIVANEPFHFFFLIDEDIWGNVPAYKVQIDGYKPSLVLKEASA
jgi:hypothetical protein